MNKELAFLCTECGCGYKTLREFIEEQCTKDNNVIKVICPECGHDPEMSFTVNSRELK